MSDRTIVFDEHHAEGLRSLAVKFRSGNDVPVERATITREEWEAVCAFVRDQETIIDDRDEHVETLTAELEALRRDAAQDKARLDWLEHMANKSGGLLLLHDGSEKGRCGLGLRPGFLSRTLREAIDDSAGFDAARQQEAPHADK